MTGGCGGRLMAGEGVCSGGGGTGLENGGDVGCGGVGATEDGRGWASP